jgi:hypothetical protein
VWAQCLAEPNNVRSSSSRGSYMSGLSAWLSQRMIGLVVHQTHIYLGSALGEA